MNSYREILYYMKQEHFGDIYTRAEKDKAGQHKALFEHLLAKGSSSVSGATGHRGLTDNQFEVGVRLMTLEAMFRQFHCNRTGLEKFTDPRPVGEVAQEAVDRYTEYSRAMWVGHGQDTPKARAILKMYGWDCADDKCSFTPITEPESLLKWDYFERSSLLVELHEATKGA